MSKVKQWMDVEKKQLKIFLVVNFGVTMLMGLLMGISSRKGNDVSIFASTQMMYPAAAVILALMLTTGKEKKKPKKFFITYLVTTVLCTLLTIGSVFFPSDMWFLAENYVLILGSILSWIMLLWEKKEVRDDFGLRFGGHNVKQSFLMMLLFVLLYMLRLVLTSIPEGFGELKAVFATPGTWITMMVLVINFYLSFIPFFGEEYGWRFFLQPMLQRRFGLKSGVILLGMVWGLWHLPLNVFFYSPDTWIYSILMHQIICISYSVFFGYTYCKTGNLWVPIVIHYINNNMVLVLAQSTDIGNQVYRWQDVLITLVHAIVLFMPFLFTKVYKKSG